MRRWGAAALAAGLTITGPVGAAPLLGSAQDVEGIAVYRDSADRRAFYYPPGRLALAADRNGQPQLSFLQLRYTGTAVTGDQGAFRTRSVLSFHVRMEGATAERLARVRAALRARHGVEPLLKPLPIRKVTAALNYLPLADSAPAPAAPPVGAPASGTAPAPGAAPAPGKSAGSGTLQEPADEPGAARPGEGYWTERVFTLAPDDLTSQALWDAFKKGRILLSLSYAFYADGIAPEPPKASGEPSKEGPGSPADAKKGPHLAFADTLAITFDAARYPDRLRQIDINDSLPPHYGVLSVACYDFNNGLRPDLHLKVVEIQAKSVNGRPVQREVTFSKTSPDLAMASVRFPFAVLLKDGYRYRVREITGAGEERVKPWKEVRSWAQLLDTTTPPEERPALPTDADKDEPR